MKSVKNMVRKYSYAEFIKKPDGIFVRNSVKIPVYISVWNSVANIIFNKLVESNNEIS